MKTTNRDYNKFMIYNTIFTFFIAIFCQQLLALEIDETLTGRILKTSSSKKTVLLNRGSSDQLTMGMHAKFSTDTSVVARGVIVELTEARSVWSLYRLSTPDLVESDVVLNVKISEPVKLTTDESRSLVRETSMQDLKPNREDKLTLPLEDVEGDIPVDLLGVGISTAEKTVVGAETEISKYPREILSRVALQALESRTTSTSGSYGGRAEMNNFMLGMEFYFTSKEKWYAHFSFLPYFQYQYQSMLSYEGSAVDSVLMELGLGFQYYLNNPHTVNKFIPFMNAFFAMGSITDSYASGVRAQGNGAVASEVKGDSTAYGVGIGVKYFFANRFTIQTLLEYYMRTDEFAADVATSDSLWSRDVSGPRVQLGLGYRF